MKIWCIADTHSFHGQLKIPKVDTVIFAGDEANWRNPIKNFPECLHFFDWFRHLSIKTKIFIAGNHSTAIYNKYLLKQDIEAMGIHYLLHESKEIEGINFFGSPYTPSFGRDWSFMVKRNKMKVYWDFIPKETEILITHGPAKGYLDITDDKETKKIVQVGCKSLTNKVAELENLKMHVFGHIHSAVKKIATFNNSGAFLSPDGLWRINASCLSDRNRVLTSKGYVVEWDEERKRIISVNAN